MFKSFFIALFCLLPFFQQEEMQTFVTGEGWVAFQYPSDWQQYVEDDEVYLFSNPNVWEGSMRLYTVRLSNKTDGEFDILNYYQQMRDANPDAVYEKNETHSLYMKENIEEENGAFTIHQWLMGNGNTIAFFTYTTDSSQDNSLELANKMIATVRIK